MSNCYISIVIPVYNGEQTLSELHKRIKDFFLLKKYTYEIIFVYDCGKDKSWQVIQEIIKENKNVSAIRLTRNYGQHNAIICGFKYAQGDFIVTMDEDLQHDPVDVEKLISKQKEQDFDVIYGKYEVLKHTIFRNTTSTLLRKIISIGIPELHPDYSPYRLIKAEVAKKTLEMNNSYTFLDGYLSWITSDVSSCTVSHNKRYAGKSSYNIKKLINHSINIFFTFSNLPVRLLTISSIGVFLITFIYTLYLIIRKIVLNDLVPGYSSMMVVLGLGVGIIMMGMGIVGEYIYRINLKTTRKPNFIEKEIL